MPSLHVVFILSKSLPRWVTAVAVHKLFTMFAYAFISIIMYKDFQIVLGVLWIETVHSF